ncbi:hypothetical protein KL918_000478 [Ogataea parapolymorpha]|uniref:Cyclin n=1 Tax=Ogataea parapolymorpha (strain ATCC 26012 / BCRC 20466 / JCM 22074 / NRRL Y-7560 / DL-1) TaxID=871575 RepID=W1Q7Y5_OGAPD|nr:Cyclin [Ogataea parapolymorpha DL-1]ESW96523.1 Cyclin [Ogataea parapolymorpha DL-1]KAG7870274.1 hypothetical protein KL918_000478 [Ogataea parapolymorpha]KAG7875223.1 hypothetical protein KL916_000835 [Ogataea parapolymorpha]
MSDDQALEIFLKSPVTQDMIHHLVTVTLQVLPCESSKTITQKVKSPADTEPVLKTKPLPSLMTFITKLVRYTNVYTGTLMSTIVFLNRLKAKLPRDAQGLPCTRHRIFLACLIISSKHHNDSSPKNKHWSKYTDGLFRKEDVNLMERQLLMLLDWDLKISKDELLRAWKRFLDPIRAELRKKDRTRKPMPATPAITVTASPASPVLLTPVKSLCSSRSSSVSSLDTLHSRASSVSSTSSQLLDDYSLGKLIDTVAQQEEQQLNNLMRQYCSVSSHSIRP